MTKAECGPSNGCPTRSEIYTAIREMKTKTSLAGVRGLRALTRAPLVCRETEL